ncbi:PIG-L family deacetylase [Streptomyces genisteinicus]|uniref:PIG-L family deacetylase n=1 Tax=Streptomyces genisteinicus TaxID=2768068 RepID=A0A7H0HR31_9ACTN|nr:PIG-L family deacetylase [Streptomyces genisteinicus]QNP62997.1 PIG-L family deacetylase [Streptomyces genisteinicus]
MRTSGPRLRSALLSRRGPTAALLIAPVAVAGWFAGAAGGASPAPRAAGDTAAAHSAPRPSVPPPARKGETGGGAAAPASHGPASVVQVVAHPDDDLFFMNPDTRQSLVSGSRLTSVYLTAGESDGVNAARTGPLSPPSPPAADKAAYAEARQNGIRAAYAEMATGDRTSPWRRTAIPTAGGATAELDVLAARPGIALVWVQLREAGSVTGDRPVSLHGLWDGRVGALPSQLASGSPVRRDFAYTKEDVVATVSGLLERFRPTHVRMQDPTPGRVGGDGPYTDHQDHLFGARFAQAALARYARVPDRPAFSVQNYLGYFTSGLPRTLDPGAAAAKLRTMHTYAWTDPGNYCGSPAGCGDRKVAARPRGHGWTDSVRYTRGESTSWTQPGRDGGLWAFSVLDTRLAVWHRAPGAHGAWSGPRLLPGAGLDSGVTSVRLRDGRVAVFATRTTLGEGPGGYRREVVSAVQRTPDGAFGPWRSLGTPERDDASGLSDISAPAAAVDRAGRITVYLRTSRYTLSSLAQRDDGSWTGWRDRGGRDLHGDPVVASDASGRQHVFAAGPATVWSWTQQAPGAPLTGPAATGLPPTTLALSAAPDGDGVRLWFRKPASGAVRTVRFSGPVASGVTELGGPAGFGPVSASGPGNTLLAARSGTGVPGVSFPPAGGNGAAGSGGSGGAGAAGRTADTGRWHAAGPLFVGAPSGTGTGLGAVGQDGRLYWSPPGGSGGWTPVG